MRASILAIVSLAALVPMPAAADDPVLLHAAGSLREALTEIAARFEVVTGSKVAPRPRCSLRPILNIRKRSPV